MGQILLLFIVLFALLMVTLLLGDTTIIIKPFSIKMKRPNLAMAFVIFTLFCMVFGIMWGAMILVIILITIVFTWMRQEK